MDFHLEYKASTIYNLEIQFSYWNGIIFGASIKSQGNSVCRLRAGLKKGEEKVGINNCLFSIYRNVWKAYEKVTMIAAIIFLILCVELQNLMC